MQEPTRLDYLNIDNDVPKQPDHSEDQDVFYDEESGDEKDPKISSPKSQPTKEENGQGWFAWGLEKARSVMTEVVVGGADVTKPYSAKDN
ncbi:hypothetical protein [Wolbachia endosymbiont of Oedothorax gibbosus]|uniref:hypothetical protein n=1 Tax=Wolbachia endosymbiont of Oedothorax gibbosus TaxID=931100 RepID=UPI002023D389|nr:hypothetical protein [Wolbachia endosymbiont of Oedothorax gibbosus]